MRSPLKNTAIFLQREIKLILVLDRDVTEKNIIYFPSSTWLLDFYICLYLVCFLLLG